MHGSYAYSVFGHVIALSGNFYCILSLKVYLETIFYTFLEEKFSVL